MVARWAISLAIDHAAGTLRDTAYARVPAPKGHDVQSSGDQAVKGASSPYATGGGGVRLEHEFAACALASLLLGQPVEGLGDDVTPTRVAMQQEAHSPVDDVLVHGASPGGERTLLIACRRRPTLGKSDESTVKLYADYVKVVLDKQPVIDSGEIRLGLAVAGPYGPAAELAVLTDAARLHPDRASFESAVTAPGAYSAAVRARLTNVDELVAEALNSVLRPAGACRTRTSSTTKTAARSASCTVTSRRRTSC